jgi:hypothetical protein
MTDVIVGLALAYMQRDGKSLIKLLRILGEFGGPFGRFGGTHGYEAASMTKLIDGLANKLDEPLHWAAAAPGYVRRAPSHACVGGETSAEPSRWAHDAQGIPLCRVCSRCEAEKMRKYRPEILSGYDQRDVDEPIEGKRMAQRREVAAGVDDLALRLAKAPKPPVAFEPEDNEELDGWDGEEVDRALRAISARDELLNEAIAMLRLRADKIEGDDDRYDCEPALDCSNQQPTGVVMGTFVNDEIEDLAGLAACARSRGRARKSDVVDIARKWRSIRHLLPNEPRSLAVDDEVEQAEFHGPVVARGLLEAVARYAIWHEGYAFAR